MPSVSAGRRNNAPWTWWTVHNMETLGETTIHVEAIVSQSNRVRLWEYIYSNRETVKNFEAISRCPHAREVSSSLKWISLGLPSIYASPPRNVDHIPQLFPQVLSKCWKWKLRSWPGLYNTLVRVPCGRNSTLLCFPLSLSLIFLIDAMWKSWRFGSFGKCRGRVEMSYWSNRASSDDMELVG
jgi:hypothetical protein